MEKNYHGSLQFQAERKKSIWRHFLPANDSILLTLQEENGEHGRQEGRAAK